jgi:hypothetical protein
MSSIPFVLETALKVVRKPEVPVSAHDAHVEMAMEMGQGVGSLLKCTLRAKLLLLQLGELGNVLTSCLIQFENSGLSLTEDE